MRKTIRILSYATLSATAFAAMPSHAEITTADRLGTALLVQAPDHRSASSGTSAASARAVPENIALIPDRIVEISPNTAKRWLNVDYGDTVEFVVHQPDATQRIVAWRFDGMDNIVNYGDIDPNANFARDLKIYVNQASNPMRAVFF
jgi:hypothetical protein